MTKEIQNKETSKISIHNFYFETPLYEPINIKDLEGDILNGEVDAYSRINHIDTTYTIYSESGLRADKDSGYIRSRGNKLNNKLFDVKLNCKRKGNDILVFNLITFDNIIMKTGQYPSLADIQFAELGKKYDKVLPKDDLHDFKKAIGLISHGAGAGAFVYLRRIFERLIIDTYNANKNELGLEDKDFNNKRMDEKVGLLKNVLPEQLLEMKSVYGILSKGVHELSEDDCKKYFSPIKVSIELILDQKREIKIKKERDEKVKKEIEKIRHEVK